MNVLKVILEVVTCLFYLSAGIVAVMTYISARKTILQPIKTEVFKKQVEDFTKIMELFNGKDEIELRKFFGFDKMIIANAIQLLDSYAELFFNIEFDHDKRPYNRKDCPTSMMSKEFADKYFDIANDPTIKSENEYGKNEIDPKVKATIWNSYKCGMISIPNENLKALKNIDCIMKSPFLTTKSIEFLKEINEVVIKNTNKIRWDFENDGLAVLKAID
jgi:hypothetical protein